jgi:hypothetical protein
MIDLDPQRLTRCIDRWYLARDADHQGGKNDLIRRAI